MKKVLIAIGTASVLMFVAAPLGVMAASAPTDNNGAGSADPAQSGFQLVSCSPKFNTATQQLDNNCDYNQLIFTVARIINYVLYIIAPIVLGMMVWTGFKYMTAHGDVNAVADAKRMLVPIALGVFFIFSAYVIVYKVVLGYLLKGDLGGITKDQIINPNGN